MLKTYFRNKFRIRNIRTNTIVKLNQSVDKNGNDIFTSSFDLYTDAETELNRFLQFAPQYKPYYRIESYSDTTPFDLDIREKSVHKEIEKIRLFSGKGLAVNAGIPKRDENRYSPSKWYGKDVWFAQSTERNKGTSLIAKLGDKKRSTTFVDTITYERMSTLKNDGTFSLHKDIVDHMIQLHKDGKFANRLEMKAYLKDKGYSSRKIHKICNQMFI